MPRVFMVQATMSTSGFVDDPRQIATNLIEYYNSSDPDQNTLAIGSVRSVTDLALKYAQEPTLLAQAMNTDLQALFERYFSNVDINVRATLDPNNEGRFNIVVDGTYIYKNNRYSLDERFNVNNEGEGANVI